MAVVLFYPINVHLQCPFTNDVSNKFIHNATNTTFSINVDLH